MEMLNIVPQQADRRYRLGALYGVTTKRFNEQVRRNAKRFPADFMFRLNAPEVSALRSQIATSNPSHRGGRRYRWPILPSRQLPRPYRNHDRRLRRLQPPACRRLVIYW
jgi:ORF6N domain